MRRYRLTLEYDGSQFSGWQWQSDQRTVQGVLEDAIHEIIRTRVRVYAAGRTDAGVHAMGQVVHVDMATQLKPWALRSALTAVLPDDIAISVLDPVPADFDARHSALSKRYRYRILNRAQPSPLRLGVTWHLRSRLDLKAMREASDLLKGTHDFAAFRGAPGGMQSEEDGRRSLDRLDWVRAGDEIQLIAEGRSFLRYMVRNLAGTLAEVGLGRRNVSSVAEALLGRDRRLAGQTAPAHGLCLEEVRYAPTDLRA